MAAMLNSWISSLSAVIGAILNKVVIWHCRAQLLADAQFFPDTSIQKEGLPACQLLQIPRSLYKTMASDFTIMAVV